MNVADRLAYFFLCSPHIQFSENLCLGTRNNWLDHFGVIVMRRGGKLNLCALRPAIFCFLWCVLCLFSNGYADW